MLKPPLMEAVDFAGAAFEALTWRPAAERASDEYVQCDLCARWHHYICAAFPPPEQLPSEWALEEERFACAARESLSNHAVVFAAACL